MVSKVLKSNFLKFQTTFKTSIDLLQKLWKTTARNPKSFLEHISATVCRFCSKGFVFQKVTQIRVFMVLKGFVKSGLKSAEIEFLEV
jgi:hypothetical protein